MSTSVSGDASSNVRATRDNNTTPSNSVARDSQVIATQQLQERAITVLANEQLMLRYALANDLSVPKVRVYFEKVAGGFEPKPIIKKWDVFED
ncbi:hypothetical protein LTS08_007087 [Lithohypha guttulata]|uniref:uncharacterized protein n=1 Tax=Lithohypha guttulata TaxID=1690604 RepID=UPI002DE0AA8E|nr:hypothetical protein LTR51_005573 [Lithohypha guttulata]KAK5097067.1 hypothetical protein LTS08_007087 [Lithohypha guttulata]